MTVHDRCTDTAPHAPHRAQYGPWGVKDCPGVPAEPTTPAGAPTLATTSTPGPAVDLIEHAARIISAKMSEPHTAPYHWAGALWEAGMLVGPGTAAPVPSEPPREKVDPTSLGIEALAAALADVTVARVRRPDYARAVEEAYVEHREETP